MRRRSSAALLLVAVLISNAAQATPLACPAQLPAPAERFRPLTNHPAPWPAAKLKAAHPRLYVSEQRLARLRARWNDPRFADLVTPYRGKQTPIALALRGLATSDAAPCAAAVTAALAEPFSLAGQADAGFADSAALVFDWCYAALAPDQRRSLTQKIDAANKSRAESLGKRFQLHEAHYLGFHAYLAGVLAIEGEPGVASHLRDAQNALQNWIEYENEIQGDGTYKTYAYQDLAFALPAFLFSSATDPDFVKRSSFIADRPEVLLRLLSADGAGIVAGPGDQAADGKGWLLANQRPSAIGPLMAADHDRSGLDQYVGELMRKRQGWASSSAAPLWLALLYYDDSLAPVAPGSANLPLDRFYPVGGMVDLRSSWEAPDSTRPATDLWFYAGPRTAHAEPDAGHFTLRRGDDDLITGGANYYGSPSRYKDLWGSTSFARNTMVFSPVGSPHPDHDGGQVAKTPERLAAAHYPNSYRLVWFPAADQYQGEITDFHIEGGLARATGDLTQAYDPAHVRSYRRTIVQVTPDVFLRDRFDLTGVGRVRMVLHHREKPEFSGARVVAGSAASGILEAQGDNVVITRGASQAVVKILSPGPVLLRAVGGPGFEHHIDGVEVDPADSAQDWLLKHPELKLRMAFSAGQWRTEFETDAAAARGEMIALISVGAKGTAPATASLRHSPEGTVVSVGLPTGSKEIRFPADAPAAAQQCRPATH